MDLTVFNWNMARASANWGVVREFLLDSGPAVALVQEAVEIDRPSTPADLKALPGGEAGHEWQTLSNGYRRLVTAIAWIDGRVEVEPFRRVPLAEASGNELTISHAGSYCAADVILPDGNRVAVVSLYGVWEKQDRVGIYTEATMHRTISDITPLLHKPPGGRLLIAGDFNAFYRYGDYWDEKYMTAFNRLEAYGMQLVGPFGTAPLPDCPCKLGEACRHVRTYAHHRKETNRVLQLDFVLASPALATSVRSCTPVPDFAFGPSDHLPIVTTIELPASDQSLR